jgi:hypothetical protein
MSSRLKFWSWCFDTASANCSAGSYAVGKYRVLSVIVRDPDRGLEKSLSNREDSFRSAQELSIIPDINLKFTYKLPRQSSRKCVFLHSCVSMQTQQPADPAHLGPIPTAQVFDMQNSTLRVKLDVIFLFPIPQGSGPCELLLNAHRRSNPMFIYDSFGIQPMPGQCQIDYSFFKFAKISKQIIWWVFCRIYCLFLVPLRDLFGTRCVWEPVPVHTLGLRPVRVAVECPPQE